MSLLSRFFKPKKAPETVEDRIASLQQLSETEIINIATTSAEDRLREEATRKITYGKPLLDLALGSYPPRVNQVARQRIGQLLDADEALVEKLVSDTSSQADLLILTGYSNAASQKVFDRITDEAVLLDIALQGKTTQVRQRAVDKITTREKLETLLKEAKGKDKAVFKIAKTKLSVFKDEDTRIKQIQAKAAAVCDDAERLIKRDIDKLFHAKLELIESAWLALTDEAKDGSVTRYNEALSKVRTKLGAQVAAIAAEKELAEEDQQAKDDLHQANLNIRRLIAGLYQAKTIDSEQHAAFTAGLGVLQSVAQRVAERNLPIKQHFDTHAKLVEAANQLWQQLEQDGALQELADALKTAEGDEGIAIKQKLQRVLRFSHHINDEAPAVVLMAQASISDWVQASKTKAELEKKTLKDIQDLIRKANWAVDGGRVRQARGIFKDISTKKETLNALPQHVEGKLEDLEAAIQKLGDWHSFATTPKKEVVVEQMEKLVGIDMHPNDLSEKIKGLQAEWKTLCKGGDNQDQELWERLQTAADKAFEPCRVFFDEQAQERESNQAKREELMGQMQQYYDAYDWEAAVWKDVEQTLRVARETWQSFWPVPRKNIKDLQQRFDAILDLIHAKINNAYQKSKEAKENLVEQAAKLSDRTDTSQAIDAAKRLQSQWQSVGRSWRKDDQSLWKAFRANCDAVFEKRQQESEEINNERVKELEAANEILTSLEAVLAKEGQEFFDAKAHVEELKARFQRVGELPRSDAKKVSNTFNRLIEDIESKTQKERNRAQAQQWLDVFAIAEKVREYEFARAGGSPNDALLEEATSRLDSGERWPAGTADALRMRIDSARSDESVEDDDASEKTLKLLCIRAEILADLESPESDKSLRMEYQVQQLQQGFGQGDGRSQNITRLTLEWLQSHACLEANTYQDLLKRFNVCQEKLLG